MTGGESVGRYRLLQLLGRGGMGEVYLAAAQGAAGFEKLVALKVLRDVHRADDSRREGLWREALLGAHLDHEGIVQALDLWEEEGTYYVAFEYVRGFSLARVLEFLAAREEEYDLRSAVHVVRSIADVLVYLHGLAGSEGQPLGLIHGDVTPSNVLLAADGRIKLSDFGVAAFEGEEVELRGQLAGKQPFLPPEAREGAARTQSFDIYALGVVLSRAVERVGQADRPALDAVIERATSPAGCRFGTAAELREALDRAYPRQVGDGEHHAAYVESLFVREDFVAAHGELPSAGGASSSINPEAYEETEAVTVGVRAKEPLRFGVSPAHGARIARARASRLVELLSERLGRSVTATPFADYESLEECLLEGEVDLAWMPPASFAAAAERGAGLVAVAERCGRPSFDAALVVREDAAIRDFDDLRGATVAWVDRRSAAGYIFVAAELRRRLGPAAEIFAREHVHGSHQAVCEAVANGWVDAGATYAVRNEGGALVHAGWIDLLPEGKGQLRPLFFTGPVPGDNIAHCPGMAPEVVRELRDLWTSLSADAEARVVVAEIFNAEGFVRADLELYRGIREALRLVGG